jgi:hypothetical protein
MAGLKAAKYLARASVSLQPDESITYEAVGSTSQNGAPSDDGRLFTVERKSQETPVNFFLDKSCMRGTKWRESLV